jgi:hypothetical protein
MAINNVNVGQELLNVPMGDMVRSMALAIADAQWSLDKASMVVAELMSGHRLLRNLETGQLLDKSGQPLKEGSKPEFVDSRVFFGHSHDGNDRKAEKVSMMELGFVPNFYQFVETVIEVRIAIRMTGSTEETRRQTESRNTNTTTATTHGIAYWWYSRDLSTSNSSVAYAASVDAGYSNKYSYSVDGSSLLRTKLVPVPPPPILQERIRALMELERQKETPPGSA